MRDTKLNVFIIDDSIVFRNILVSIVEAFPETNCVGKSYSGEGALRQLKKLDVDLVIIDVFMPDMDGLAVFKAIKKNYPNLPVVMISGVVDQSNPLVMEALKLGALGFIEKANTLDAKSQQLRLEARLKEVVDLVYSGNFSNHSMLGPRIAKHRKRLSKVDMVLIGSSTGGPSALRKVIPLLDSDIGCPVLIVQHMPEIYTASLAKHLAKESKIDVSEAASGMIVSPNQVLIAPGGHHMGIIKGSRGYEIALNKNAPVNSCRPSIDVLFESTANNFSGEILVIILTGMGRDGTAGVRALRKVNPLYCIVQSPDTCIVDAMPRHIIEDGLADKILPIDSIAEAINLLARRNRAPTNFMESNTHII